MAKTNSAKTKQIGKRPSVKRRKGLSGKKHAKSIKNRRERKRRKKEKEVELVKKRLASGRYF